MSKALYTMAGVVVGVGALGYGFFRHFQAVGEDNKEKLVFVTESNNSGGSMVGQSSPDLNSDAGGVGVGEPSMSAPPSQGNPGWSPGGSSSPMRRDAPWGNGRGRTPNPGGNVQPTNPRVNPGQPSQTPPARPRDGAVSASSSFEDAMFRIANGLVFDKEVQKELNLTPEQVKEYRDVRRAAVRPGSGGSGNPDMMNELMARADALKKILKPGQKARFLELALQSVGPTSLVQPELAQEFDLSAGETEKIREVASDFGRKMMEKMNQGANSGSGGGMMNMDMGKIMEAKSQLDAEVLKLLSPQAQAKWKQRVGKPFKFSTPMGMGGMMRGMMGGGNGQRNRGNPGSGG
jgi:hypothetical protein